MNAALPLLLTALTALTAGQAVAATWTSPTCQLVDVQATVNEAAFGDIVTVPSGTATWAGYLNVTNNISIIGAGVGQTVIYDANTNRTTDSALVIYWSPVPPTGLCRLSGIGFFGTITGTTNAQTLPSTILFTGTNDTVRIDNCELWNPQGFTGLSFQGAICGVVCSNYIHWTNQDVISIQHQSLGGNGPGNTTGNGDESWHNPVYWGTTNQMLVFEHNIFDFEGQIPGFPVWALSDSDQGARYVYRYNSFTNCSIYVHSSDTGGRVRSTRAFEVYGNIVTAPYWNTGWIVMRGGTCVVFSNIVTGFTSLLAMGNYRTIEWNSGWNAANGLNPWDSNNPVMLCRLTNCGPNNAQDNYGYSVITDTNYNWTLNQWTTNGYIAVNLTQGGTNYGVWSAQQNYGAICTNSANSLTVIPSAWGPMYQTNGDVFGVYEVASVFDGIGNGSGDLITTDAGGNPTNSTGGLWPHEVSEPIYQWSNTVSGVANYQIGTILRGFNTVRAGAQYFDNTPKPGYVAMADPYPTSITNPTTPAQTPVTVFWGNVKIVISGTNGQ